MMCNVLEDVKSVCVWVSKIMCNVLEDVKSVCVCK